MYNLKYVHQLMSDKNFIKASEVLESLIQKNPKFLLYNSKLKECQIKLQQSGIKPIKLQQSEVKPKNEVSSIKKTIGSNYEAKRKSLSEAYSKDKSKLSVLIELAKLDIMDQRHSDALHKAKVVIEKDSSYREAYQIAEQMAIQLGLHEDANNYFLSQPPIINPTEARKRGLNPAIPKQFKINPILGAGNDYRHILKKTSLFISSNQKYTKTVSIIIPVYNRFQVLANTLAALTYQTYPQNLIEIIVVDDGSSDQVLNVIKKYETKLNLNYIRQEDKGYRLAKARNLGIRCSTGSAIIIIDADILPSPQDVELYMQVMHTSDDVVLIGHRRYVDVSRINDNDILNDISNAMNLPSINPNNDVAANDKDNTGIAIDWRFDAYKNSNYLINDLWPFTKASGGNIAFSRALIDKAGLVDEDFQAWGCEDGEHGYRLYNAGAYFIPMLNITSLHQEPLDEVETAKKTDTEESFRAKGHKITQRLFSLKCPAPVVRKYLPNSVFEIPKVSIYIPAYNAESYIVEAIQSCLDQSFGDLEVCICNDGSTDSTLELLEKHFSKVPNVRWISQENGGIGKATNTAINLCRGLYIAQLDADDLLKKDAVCSCVAILDYKDVDAVYTDTDYIDGSGNYIRDAWCGGEFSREWMATGMIATHFRMFRKRIWSRTIGCNEQIKNAVDLDLWLKIYEKGNIEHVHKILYSYRWHGKNTSIIYRKDQETNHIKVVQDSIKRMKLDRFWNIKPTGNRLNPRELKVMPVLSNNPIKPNDIIFLIPSCEKYSDKMNSVRNTWAKELKSFGFRYFFLIGKPKLPFAEVIDDVLYTPCADDYESLLLKLVLGYEFIYQTLDFSYIYKIDDDCYPNLNKLVDTVLPQLAGKSFLGGATHPKGASMNNKWHFGKCSKDIFDKPYRFDVAPFEFTKGGYGYFLRRDILPFLCQEISTFREELTKGIYSYEDMRISEIFHKNDIFVNKISDYQVIEGSKFNSKIDLDWMLIYDIQDGNIMKELSNER